MDTDLHNPEVAGISRSFERRIRIVETAEGGTNAVYQFECPHCGLITPFSAEGKIVSRAWRTWKVYNCAQCGKEHCRRINV